MLFLDPKNIKFDRQIVKLILICILKLYDTDSNLVKNTSLATLRQLFSLIFSNLPVFSVEKIISVFDTQDEELKEEVLPIEKKKGKDSEPKDQKQTLHDIAIEFYEGLYCTLDQEYENNPNWPLAASLENKCLALDLY